MNEKERFLEEIKKISKELEYLKSFIKQRENEVVCSECTYPQFLVENKKGTLQHYLYCGNCGKKYRISGRLMEWDTIVGQENE